MKSVFILAAVFVFLVVRITLRRRRHAAPQGIRPLRTFRLLRGDIGLVAGREIRERLRGRILRVTTVLMLAVVGAAIIIPTLHSNAPTSQRIGVVGTLPPSSRSLVVKDAKANDARVTFVEESSVARADHAVRTNRINAAIINGQKIIVTTLSTSSNSSELEQIAQDLGLVAAVHAAGISPAQTLILSHAHAVTIASLVPVSSSTSSNIGVSVIGLILIFAMLSQYNTWTLMGVMEEKSSRVIEVLLSTVRPLQLLTGKVLGIGLVAFSQAALIVAFALIVAKSVGSSLIHGAAPLEVAAILVWLMLGYAFYCWVYAAAGSMAERQDQIQTLALPLSLPLLFGYIFSLTSAESSHLSLFFKVLAYLPPTAPFAMPVLVGYREVSWYGFVASVMISVICTVGVARFAAGIYRRASLRTGGKVRLRDLFSS